MTLYLLNFLTIDFTKLYDLKFKKQVKNYPIKVTNIENSEGTREKVDSSFDP